MSLIHPNLQHILIKALLEKKENEYSFTDFNYDDGPFEIEISGEINNEDFYIQVQGDVHFKKTHNGSTPSGGNDPDSYEAAIEIKIANLLHEGEVEEIPDGQTMDLIYEYIKDEFNTDSTVFLNPEIRVGAAQAKGLKKVFETINS